MSFSIGDRVLVPGRAVIIKSLDADGDYKVMMDGDTYPIYVSAGEVEIDQEWYDDQVEDDDWPTQEEIESWDRDDKDDDGDLAQSPSLSGDALANFLKSNTYGKR